MNKKAFNEGFIKYCAKQGCTDLNTIDRLMRFGEVQLKKEAAYMRKKAQMEQQVDPSILASISQALMSMFGVDINSANEGQIAAAAQAAGLV